MKGVNVLTTEWRTSTRSGGNGCVEAMIDNNVHVRDSKDPTGPILQFPPPQWAAFINAVCVGTIRP